MKKGLETYLVSFALVLLATIILYQVYMTPNLSPAVINKTVGTSNVKNNSETTTNSSCKITNNRKNTKNIIKSSGVVNINTAGVDKLATLPGIGEVKANAIIQYRNNNGNFSSADDLTNVKGIGEKTVDKLRNLVTY